MSASLQSESDRTLKLFTAANMVTLGRLCAVPLIMFALVRERLDWVSGIFLFAAVSDALDGWLARCCGGNLLGKIMDPIADKFLLVTMFVSLAWLRLLPEWLTFLVVFRDAVIVGVVVAMKWSGMRVEIRPAFLSKANTFLQIVLIAVTLQTPVSGSVLAGIGEVLVGTVAATTLASGFWYLWRAVSGG